MIDEQASPYLRLWAQVLGLAIMDARAYLKRERWKGADLPDPTDIPRIDERTAIAWLSDSSNRPGGFRWICSLLDLDVEFTIREILKPRPKKAVANLIKEIEIDD